MNNINTNYGTTNYAQTTYGNGVTAEWLAQIQNMSAADLRQLANSPLLTPEQLKVILNELANRAFKEGWLDEEEEDELTMLLRKLNNGTITRSELERLGALTGFAPADFNCPVGKEIAKEDD